MGGLGTKHADREAVDRLLDDVVFGPATPDAPARYAPALAAATALRRALPLEVPDAAAARHLGAIAELGVSWDVTARAPARPRGRRLAVVLAATLALGLGVTATASAAQDALPGDLLYPVKRAVEVMNLALHPSASSKGRLHLTYASRRLAELEALLALRRAGENVDVGAAMSAYRAELAAAEHDLLEAASEGAPVARLLAAVQTRIQAHVQRLTVLRDERVPEQARRAVEKAIERARRAQERVGRGSSTIENQGPPDEPPGKPDDRPSPPGRSGDAPGQTQSSTRAPDHANAGR